MPASFSTFHSWYKSMLASLIHRLWCFPDSSLHIQYVMDVCSMQFFRNLSLKGNVGSCPTSNSGNDTILGIFNLGVWPESKFQRHASGATPKRFAHIGRLNMNMILSVLAIRHGEDRSLSGDASSSMSEPFRNWLGWIYLTNMIRPGISQVMGPSHHCLPRAVGCVMCRLLWICERYDYWYGTIRTLWNVQNRLLW